MRRGRGWFQANRLKDRQDFGIPLGVLNTLINERLDPGLAELDLAKQGLGAIEFACELDVLEG